MKKPYTTANDRRIYNGGHLAQVQRREPLVPPDEGADIQFRITPVQQRFLESRQITSAWGRYDYSDTAKHRRGATPAFRRVVAVMSGVLPMSSGAADELFQHALPDPVRTWLDAPRIFEPYEAHVLTLTLPHEQVAYLRQQGSDEICEGARNTIDRAIVVTDWAADVRANYTPGLHVELPPEPVDAKHVLNSRKSRIVRSLSVTRDELAFLKSRQMPRVPHSRHPDPAGAALRLVLDVLRSEASAEQRDRLFAHPFEPLRVDGDILAGLKLWMTPQQQAFANVLGRGNVAGGLRQAIDNIRWLVAT